MSNTTTSKCPELPASRLTNYKESEHRELLLYKNLFWSPIPSYPRMCFSLPVSEQQNFKIRHNIGFCRLESENDIIRFRCQDRHKFWFY